MEETYQIFVKLLDGKHRALNFTSPSISILSIKHRLREITGVPISDQRLLTGVKQLEDSSLLYPHSDGAHSYPSLHLLLRLRGGKGGFGSLLRGAATKAGQKKTNNFDACRDMSGRRLRHVNAEKKLEEWRAEAEERRLEKVAEEFIKKKAKAVAKKGGVEGSAERYVAKYMEDSARCMEEVEKSVREAIGSSKRKIAAGGAQSKRLKIWKGKRIVGDSDSDDSDDDEEEENDKSVVLDDGNQSDSSKKAEGSSGSVCGPKLNGDSSVGISSESGSEEEETATRKSSFSVGNSDAGAVGSENNDGSEPTLETHRERVVRNGDASFSQEAVVLGPEPFSEEAVVLGPEPSIAEKQESVGPESGHLEGTVDQLLNIYNSGDGVALECRIMEAEFCLNSESKRVVREEAMVVSTDVSDVVKPLDFDKFNSAAELEALGMERLKSELQSRGLKCGGTLQERAARLFLLKTTPLEMLPKKLLAKK